MEELNDDDDDGGDYGNDDNDGNIPVVMVSFCTVCPSVSNLENQSVENAGVEFVNGAYERNEFFEKINK